jgi:hypothetical protein
MPGRAGSARTSRRHHRFLDLLRRVEHADRVVGPRPALRHFFRRIVETHDPRAGFRNRGFGQDEHVAVGCVEALREVARQLDVLLLIFADRNVRRAIEQDVGCHQHRIREESGANFAALRFGFFLELRHALQLAHRRDARQIPGQLAVLAHVALHEQPRFRGIDAGGNEHHRRLENLSAQHLRLLRNGERVHVDETENVLRVILSGHPLFDRAEIVADVDRTGGLNAGKND